MDPSLRFAFIDPELARHTRITHIVMAVVGTLLMIPACLILFGISMLLLEGFGGPGRPREWAAVISAVAGSVTGGLGWCALCLLFFKRADARWHLAAWSLCALHGVVTLPGIVGWSVFVMREMLRHWPRGDIDAFLLVLVFATILANSCACILLGLRNARLARTSLARSADSPTPAIPPGPVAGAPRPTRSAGG